MKTTAHNPDAPSRHTDTTTKALDETLRRIVTQHQEGYTIDYVSACEIVREVKREHQVANAN
jgi:hypothetical protein